MSKALEQADAILQRFLGPVTLLASRRKWLLVLLGCTGFAAAGVAMVNAAAPWGSYVLIVFGAGAIVAAVMLVPGAGALRLDRDGFVVRSLFRSSRVRWQDASKFAPVSIPPSMQRMVCYDDAKLAAGTMAKLNVAITGRNSALPDSYGLSVDELARLMVQWREQAVASTG
jgi:hypothetical protein